MTAVDELRFDRELERVRLRALLAVERSASEPGVAVIERVTGELAAVEDEIARLRASGGRAEALARRLGLAADELELLWTAVAVAADPRVQPHVQILGGGDARRGLSLACHTVIAGLDGARARTLSRSLLGAHPLRRARLLVPAGDGLAPAARAWIAPARLCSWLAGDDELDEALAGAGRVVAPLPDPELDERQRETAARLAFALASPAAPVVVLEGPWATGRRTAAAAAAAAAGLSRELVALDARRLAPGREPLEAALVALVRECALRDAVPLVADVDHIEGGEADERAARRSLARALDEVRGPVVLTSTTPGVELEVARPIVRLAWGVPDTATRRTLWRRGLAGLASAVDTDLLAIRYRLGPGGVERAVASARLLAGAAPLETTHLIAGVRSNIAERVGELAQRTEVRQSWEDLVLAPDFLDQARALVARVRHAHRVLEDWGYGDKLPRGTGVAALFTGPPGTGKTMLAGLIARELDLELYQVDLSKVVSKWVGETEKQLARIFEAADAGHALLLFDEADALFARRTEVKSAVDRYANLEVNYLLQRIESFGGVSILTTNLEASIDPALRRRLACHIAFWPPGIEERKQLWQRLLTARGPLAPGLDVGRLAERFPEMTGANIRNAVLSAAFLAAAEGTSITQALLERSARSEYANMGKVLRGA